MLISLLTFSVFMVLAMVLSLLAIMATCGSTLRRERFRLAWRNARTLFKSHYLIILEAALILFLVSFLVSTFLLFLIWLLFAPFWNLLVASLTIGSEGLINLVYWIFWVMVLGLAFVTFGFLSAFHYATWTMLYLRLKQDVQARGALIRHLVEPLRRLLKIE
ncbi:MAG: hypothetical protein V1821_02140 [bacterium]